MDIKSPQTRPTDNYNVVNIREIKLAYAKSSNFNQVFLSDLCLQCDT